MCLGDIELNTSSSSSIIFQYPEAGHFRQYWHVLESASHLQRLVVDQDSSVFAPHHIQPCDPSDYSELCRYCRSDDEKDGRPELSAAESTTRGRGKCRNQIFTGMPQLQFRHGLKDLYDASLDSSSSWGFQGVGNCPGQRIFARLYLLCIFSGIRVCENGDCEARFQTLQETAPRCEWGPFRQFLFTVVACKSWRALALFTNDIWEWKGQPSSKEVVFRGGGGAGPEQSCRDIIGVFDILQWANRNWNPRFPLDPAPVLTGYHTKRALQAAQACQLKLGVCPARIWNVTMQDQGLVNIGYLEHAILRAPLVTKVDEHSDCTGQVCSLTRLNSTFQHQAHKCPSGKCDHVIVFNPTTLNEAARADSKRILAWSTLATGNRNGGASNDAPPPCPHLCSGDESYVALSHVWSDGTGVGVKSGGEVNRCLFEYFSKLTNSLGYGALWWDAISIPSESELRRAAVASMLDNYEKAKVTLVHDHDLTRFVWREDGSPAVAITLSSWFTRGWAAAELLMSRNHPVKFIFSDESGKPLIKDLDDDILVVNDRKRSDKVYSLGHIAASDIIRSLRSHDFDRHSSVSLGGPRRRMVFGLRDLLAVLHARSTSWATDRILIAGLLCLTPDEVEAATAKRKGTETALTKSILVKFHHIVASQLVHSQLPLAESGPWSWCPPSMFDLEHLTLKKKGQRLEHCSVTQGGELHSYLFQAYELHDSDIYIPYGSHPALVTRVEAALLEREKCVLLTTPNLLNRQMPLCLLVQALHIYPDSFVSCQWIGWVYIRGPEVTIEEEWPRVPAHLTNRRRLGDLGPRYPLQRMKTTDFLERDQGIIIGGRHATTTTSRTPSPHDLSLSSRLRPLSFDFTAWTLERILLSFTMSTLGPAWILSDPFLDSKRSDALDSHYPGYQKHRRFHRMMEPISSSSSSSPAPVINPSRWPPLPVHIHQNRSDLVRYLMKDDDDDDAHSPPSPTPPSLAVLAFTPDDDEDYSYISESFLLRRCSLPLLSHQSVISNCTVNHHHHHNLQCTGKTITNPFFLYWTFLYDRSTMGCDSWVPKIYSQTNFHIFSHSSSSSSSSPDLFIGKKFFDLEIKDDVKQSPLSMETVTKEEEEGGGGGGEGKTADWITVGEGETCGKCSWCKPREIPV